MNPKILAALQKFPIFLKKKGKGIFCSVMRFLVYAVYALVAGGADAFSAAGSVATGLSARSRSGIITLHASQHPSAARRVMLAGASLAGLAQLAAPKAAMAIDFRKMITGEEGASRAMRVCSFRLARDRPACASLLWSDRGRRSCGATEGVRTH